MAGTVATAVNQAVIVDEKTVSDQNESRETISEQLVQKEEKTARNKFLNKKYQFHNKKNQTAIKVNFYFNFKELMLNF
ncbi:hypothetical protein [Nonlabens xiamenensis]|uniref:hypothetical protein n=1 Tax=Nonlabens xiamenensis TaxID=2341043 RepID=UPI0013DD96C0|nr:hypothetical protein [Nonlabens xiamenensis]